MTTHLGKRTGQGGGSHRGVKGWRNQLERKAPCDEVEIQSMTNGRAFKTNHSLLAIMDMQNRGWIHTDRGTKNFSWFRPRVQHVFGIYFDVH